MAKVKLFRFRISNASSVILKGDETERWYAEGLNELQTEKQIEETINEFISDKQLISLDVTKIDVCTHRYSRGNTVDLVYTVTYK